MYKVSPFPGKVADNMTCKAGGNSILCEHGVPETNVSKGALESRNISLSLLKHASHAGLDDASITEDQIIVMVV